MPQIITCSPSLSLSLSLSAYVRASKRKEKILVFEQLIDAKTNRKQRREQKRPVFASEKSTTLSSNSSIILCISSFNPKKTKRKR
jgi:hypothetical protein